MKHIAVFILIIGIGLGSCTRSEMGTKQVMSQTGNNKAFPTNKHTKIKNKRYRADKSSIRSKQREHASYQGLEEQKQ